MHEARSVVDAAGTPVEPSEAAARRLLASSHRLAYSSFAPLLGEHLLAAGPHQPPVPSAYHMQHSWLTDTGLCAREHADAWQSHCCQQAAPRRLLGLDARV